MRSVLLLLIRSYQWVLRPLLGPMGPTCRFYPSCSCYAHQAIQRYGAWRGVIKTLTRVSRCHPWNEGGYDPVEPETSDSRSQHSTAAPRLN